MTAKGPRYSQQGTVLEIDPASASAVAALESDPFYQAISVDYVQAPERRRAVLIEYFAYSIQEGRDFGRTVHLENPTVGVAVWLLPQPEQVEAERAHRKRSFLAAALGERGYESYYNIVRYMSARAEGVVADDAWYLSIIAVDPSTQGRGLGVQLLAPTLAEADGGAITCYLETFSPRNVGFYERLGFATHAQFNEPTTGEAYALMVRAPRR